LKSIKPKTTQTTKNNYLTALRASLLLNSDKNGFYSPSTASKRVFVAYFILMFLLQNQELVGKSTCQRNPTKTILSILV
jgi:hypothetical protein